MSRAEHPIGTRCKIADPESRANGRECTVLSHLFLAAPGLARRSRNGSKDYGLFHEVDVPTFDDSEPTSWCLFSELIPIPDDKDEPAKWEDCLWQPKGVQA